ncbi:anti-sigma factor family protein [Algibacillus agarilyticus]|uniref:anti-sigma factor family protein n=1 Tax=Algibacillus agarilyticus TaxID=2234133 RepID=UPI000DD03CAB|nr:hypothetical protein [Algibacillus agarilyticus]
MNINDEMLSAFLDAELLEPQMEAIRAQLIENEALANRLAELAMVDEVIAAQYEKINTQPLPQGITDLLASIPDESNVINMNTANSTGNTTNTSVNVVSLNWWQRTQHAAKEHVALAASVALLVGFTVANVLPQAETNQWSQIANVLNHKTSGSGQVLSNGDIINPKLTFTNQQGQYCRQFDIKTSQNIQQSIACRVNNAWQLSATVYQDKANNQGEYQTASASGLMRNAIE